MIAADSFLGPLRDRGHSFVSGVPCSYLKPFINRVIDSPALNWLGAASEGEAVGINLGAYLAGRGTVTLCQNSGLGNMVNPLTSLNQPFQVPTLLVVTWRGQPGRPDEPQHEQMGRITHRLLETLEIPWRAFPKSDDDIGPALDEATASMSERSLPFALVMSKDSVAPAALETVPSGEVVATHRIDAGDSAERLTRAEAITTILEQIGDNAAVIATTGKTGRELFTLADRPGHFYVVGGMGTASAIGLGVAVNVPGQPVVVLDGDGAALMKLGALATIGARGPRNLLHIILDNEVHDSTGGQATVSRTVRFAEVAAACNYRNVVAVSRRADLSACLNELAELDGPSLIHLKIQAGSLDPLGRPTVTPVEVKARFMDFLLS